MGLKEICQPIERELIEVEQVLKRSLKYTRYKSILELSNYLLNAKGKRIRPALVLFSAKVSLNQPAINRKSIICTAAAVELIHLASLIHDDLIDNSCLRRHQTTVNFKFGEDVAIALGDYLYSVAFELISASENTDVLQCISSATKTMCEGELIQVCERDNPDLLKQRYILIVKKKTASLFAASCQAGSLISNLGGSLRNTLKEYGLNFGIAFQIIDDYLDLVGDEKELGKTPGQDIRVGELTLPILNLWESISKEERKELEKLLSSGSKELALERVRSKLFASGAAIKTKQTAQSFVNLAKEKITPLSNSDYKEGLLNLADFIMKRGFNFNGKS